MTDKDRQRRMPIGAEIVSGGGVEFRVWAPKRTRVEVVLESGPGVGTAHPCVADADGYFRQIVRQAGAGTRYRFRLDGAPELFPDPASRSQPSGPHGPSEVVDPSAFAWSDAAWKGRRLRGQVLYEMHIGTFTTEGTWSAAMAELTELASLGVTVLEVMPIADFPGRFGWGYDGVNLFAPTRLYGEPDDVRRFIDRAHALGLGVILDVVYNHLGPDGNYWPQFSDHYFNDKRHTDWGAAVNYDGKRSAGVRELVIANARYWIDEFHFDGLRLDATQDIHDESPDHIVAALVRAARAAARGRDTIFVGENEPQSAKLLRAEADGGYGLDALWNDDLHHAAHVALTGRSEAYYTDYAGTPQELLSAMKHGFLYQGQYYAWQKKTRGSPSLDIAPHRFISYLENHDQVANSAYGEHLHVRASRGKHRAITTLFLLGPATPMLFQGEEFAASSPFLYFADHGAELATMVRRGRQEFLAQFPSVACPDVAALLAPPEELSTFERCKLKFAERTTHAAAYTFYRDALALRRRDRVFAEPARVDGAVISEGAFVLRLFGPPGDDRLIVVNLGADAKLARVPEPLLAPPEGTRWVRLFSSEDARYGGAGTPPHENGVAWHLLGEAAAVFASVPLEAS